MKQFFTEMMKKNVSDVYQSLNSIGPGTIITGDITSNGDFRIDGILYGNIKSKGKVVVGASGKIDGEITCKNADFSGEINAKVIVSEMLILKSSATLNGEIFMAKLAIEPGAKFSGSCNMRDLSKDEIEIPVQDEGIEKKEESVK